MNKTAADRIPPQNIEAEQTVLSALLLGVDGVADKVAGILKKNDFYRQDHRLIYAAMLNLYNEHSPIDIVSVTTKLQEIGKLEAAGGSIEITNLAKLVPSAANVEYYAGLVKKASMRRQAIWLATKIEAKAYEDGTDPDMLLDKAEKTLLTLVTKNTQQTKAIKDIVRDVMGNIEERHADPYGIAGLSTGYPTIDKMTNGLKKGTLNILAARPSMGKTTLAINIATHALYEGKSVAFFSLEMSDEEITETMLSGGIGGKSIDLNKLITGKLAEEDWKELVQSADILSETKLHLSFADTPADILRECRRWKAKNGLALVVIDYLQLMRSGEKTPNKEQEVSKISRNLKIAARELEVPFLVLSQLSRQVEIRQDKRPTLSDLRDSGAIEQDADLACFLYRDSYYNKDVEIPEITEFIIAKQRRGKRGTVMLFFRGEVAKFYEISREQIEQMKQMKNQILKGQIPAPAPATEGGV